MAIACTYVCSEDVEGYRGVVRLRAHTEAYDEFTVTLDIPKADLVDSILNALGNEDLAVVAAAVKRRVERRNGKKVEYEQCKFAEIVAERRINGKIR